MRKMRGCEGDGRAITFSGVKESKTIMKVLVDAGYDEVTI